MNARPETARPSNPPAQPIPAGTPLPPWEQIPLQQRQELTQILADMLIRKLQALEREVLHERPS